MLRNLFPSLAVIALVVGGSFVWMQSQNSSQPQQMAELDTLLEVTDVQATDNSSEELPEMTLGAEDAPVKIVEYASFTCPHCANYHKGVFGVIKSEYIETGKVHYTVRDVYFDRFGLWAAMLARCNKGEKFFGLSDLIYARQKEWLKGGSNSEVVQNLLKLGRIAGMDDDQMDACLQNDASAQALVAEFQKNAERDEIQSTPSFIINGTKYENMSLEDFRSTIDELLAE